MSGQQKEISENKSDSGGKINVEMLIAFCAVVISIASFYATYLQANAAEKQVTAMTLPLMNFITGNFDRETSSPLLSYTIANKGVGPAKIETFLIKYKNRFFNNHYTYLEDCCEAEWEQFKVESTALENTPGEKPWMISSNPVQQIVPSGEKIIFMQLNKHPASDQLWKVLEKARWETSVAVCYCSLIDNCYWLSANNQISDTPSCKEN